MGVKRSFTSFFYGAKSAIIGAIVMFIIVWLLSTSVKSNLFNGEITSHLNLLGNVLPPLSLILTLLAMKYWSTPYMLGGLIFSFLILGTGLVDLWEFAIFAVIAAFIILRRYKLIRKSSQEEKY